MKAVTKDGLEIELEYSSNVGGPGAAPYGLRFGTTYLYAKIDGAWFKTADRGTISLIHRIKDINSTELLTSGLFDLNNGYLNEAK